MPLYVKEATEQEKKKATHLSVELLDNDAFIKANNIQEVTDPIFFVRDGIPTPEGLLSNEIFGITKDKRANTFAYINLNDWFFDPLCYILWSQMDSKIKECVHGTKKFKIENGSLVPDENGQSGVKFIKDHFDEIHIKSTESSKRDKKIEFLKRNKKNMFINKLIVIPAYYRDVNSKGGGNVSVGDLNRYYSQLLVSVRSLKESEIYGLSMSDAVKGRIQELIVSIYNWLCGTGSQDDDGVGLSKKTGIIRTSVMSKTANYGTRLVLSAPDLKAENINDLMVDTKTCALPLASAIVNFKPFILFNVRRFFENEFGGVQEHPLLNDKGKIEYYKVKNPLLVFSDEEIEAQMNRFIHGYSNRLSPVEVPLENGKTAYMMFKGRDKSIEDFVDKVDNPTIAERRMTWCDIFYMAAVEATRDKHVLITRYPIDGAWNQFPSKIRISTTKNTEKIYVDGVYYQWYPKIREKDISSNTSNMFIDTLSFTNLNLKSITGDY